MCVCRVCVHVCLHIHVCVCRCVTLFLWKNTYMFNYLFLTYVNPTILAFNKHQGIALSSALSVPPPWHHWWQGLHGNHIRTMFFPSHQSSTAFLPKHLRYHYERVGSVLTLVLRFFPCMERICDKCCGDATWMSGQSIKQSIATSISLGFHEINRVTINFAVFCLFLRISV